MTSRRYTKTELETFAQLAESGQTLPADVVREIVDELVERRAAVDERDLQLDDLHAESERRRRALVAARSFIAERITHSTTCPVRHFDRPCTCGLFIALGRTG